MNLNLLKIIQTGVLLTMKHQSGYALTLMLLLAGCGGGAARIHLIQQHLIWQFLMHQ